MNPWARKIEYGGARNTEELHVFLTNTVMIRRLKKDVQTQLPPKIRSRVPVECSEKEIREIKTKIAELQATDGFGSNTQTADMQALTRKAPHNLISELFTLTGKAKAKAAAEYVAYLVHSDCKFLVFAHHKEVLDVIEAHVAKEKATYIRIDGSTPVEKRELYVKQFQNDPKTKVAILSITACGHGLTLTAAGTVVFAELYWVPGQIVQAEDRCHRIGTEYKSIDVHYLIAEESLDDMVWKTLNRKWSTMSEALDGCTTSIEVKHLQKGTHSHIPKCMTEDEGDPTEIKDLDACNLKKRSLDVETTRPITDFFKKQKT